MASEKLERTFVLAEQGLREIGYVNGLARRNYRFAEMLASSDAVHSIPLATFAQEPPSYRNACIGVCYGGVGVDRYASLGAPQLLEINEDDIRRWKITSSGTPQLLQHIEPDELLQAIRHHRDDWSPESIGRARAIGFTSASYQLDFFDAGLLPLLESAVRQKLDRLLRDVLAVSTVVYQEQNLGKMDYPGLFRLVFRLLAAKLLADRGHPGVWLAQDPRTVIANVEKFYFHESAAEPVLTDPATQQIAWEKIRTSFHLQNISMEALAYVYENTLVDQEQRQALGIHSTPPEVAEYIVQHLPFEALEQGKRRVFEPFAGHGALLIAALGRLRSLLPRTIPPQERHRYLVDMLTGMEVDAFAVEVARLSLMLADYPNPNGWRLLQGNVFADPRLDDELTRAQIVLCNPPFESFLARERQAYRDLQSVNKAANLLLRTMQHPPELLGFILPRVFIDGQLYRDVRRRITDTYGQIDLVSLPDVAFQHSGVETVLLTASQRDKEPVSVRLGMVTATSYNEFAQTGQPQNETTATLSRSAANALSSLWIDPLRQVWEALNGLPILGQVTEIHRGIEYQLSLKTHEELLISQRRRRGFAAGLARVSDGFEPFLIRSSVYLNMDPKVMQYEAYLLPWAQPKVIANAARLSRGPWVLTGASDREGLVVTQRFHGIWPTGHLPIEVIAAILNGPVANAFMSSQRTSRDNRIKTMTAIPVPRFTPQAIESIRSLVQQYQEVRQHWLDGYSDARTCARRCQELQSQLDAEILTAYDLSPRRERELLDYFSGAARPGPVEFTGYYPPDFRPALPWRMFVSGALERATVQRTLDRLPILNDPVISEALAEVVLPTE